MHKQPPPPALRRLLASVATRLLACEARAVAAWRLPESPPGLYLILSALTVAFVGAAWQVDSQLLTRGHLLPRFESVTDVRAYNGPATADTAGSYLGAFILTALAVAMIRSWVMIVRSRRPETPDEAPSPGDPGDGA